MNKVSVNGNDNISLNNIKDSIIIVNKNDSDNPSESVFKKLYDTLIEEQGVRDFYFVTVISRGGIDWYRNECIIKGFHSSMLKLEALAREKRFYIPNDLFSKIMSHCKLTLELKGHFEMLVMAISSADQDAITPACDITYDREIDCTSEFVNEAMEIFNLFDPHHIYLEYAECYSLHDKSVKELMKHIKKH